MVGEYIRQLDVLPTPEQFLFMLQSAAPEQGWIPFTVWQKEWEEQQKRRDEEEKNKMEDEKAKRVQIMGSPDFRQVTYTVAVQARHRGMYYAVNVLDFEDERCGDLDPNDKKNVEKIKDMLQEFVIQWIIDGKPIPEPRLKKYDAIGGDMDPTYHDVTVKVWDRAAELVCK
jgi:hypothetical protein